MIKVYYNYGIYNEQTGQTIEEDEILTSLTYWDNGRKVTLEDVYISGITSDEITIELEDSEEAVIPIEKIVDWE